jgi:hypothetical protein
LEAEWVAEPGLVEAPVGVPVEAVLEVAAEPGLELVLAPVPEVVLVELEPVLDLRPGGLAGPDPVAE